MGRGANKMHYGRCASGVLVSDMDFSRLTPPCLLILTMHVDFITHGLVPKVPSLLSLTCFQFFTISDPAAALSSIMLFLLLDTVHMKGRTTGWSKIPGGPTGEWKATS